MTKKPTQYKAHLGLPMTTTITITTTTTTDTLNPAHEKHAVYLLHTDVRTEIEVMVPVPVMMIIAVVVLVVENVEKEL